MNMAIGSKIKSLRLQNHMTQQDLCGSYMNRVVLSRIENNKMIPSLEQLSYISQKFGKPADYFISNSLENRDLKERKNNSYEADKKSYIYELFLKEDYYDIAKLDDDVLNNGEIPDDFNLNYYIGISYFKLGIYFKALKPLKKYMHQYINSAKSMQQEHISELLSCINTLTVIINRDKNYSKSKSYLRTALKYICLYNYGSNRMSFVIYNNLAYLYLKTGEYHKAIRLLESFFVEHDDMLFIDVAASMYLTLNICCCNTGDYSKSLKYIKKAMYLYLYKDKFLEAGECYLNYINSLRFSGNFEEALTVLNKCKQKCEQYSDLYQRFIVQELILKFNMKDFQGTINEAKTINLKNLSMRNRYDCFFIIGHACFVLHDYKKAHEYLIICEKFYSSSNYYKDLCLIYDDIFNITKELKYKELCSKYKDLPASRKNICI